jgi:hypothetical protein
MTCDVLDGSLSGLDRVLCGGGGKDGTLRAVMRYRGMESGDEQRGTRPKKPRGNKVIIKSPLRLAVFSIAILMLAAFALRIIADASPETLSASAPASKVSLF